jgi:hypothetical protein
MKNLKTFESFRSGYIDKRAISKIRKPENIGYVKEPVEIRVDIEKIPHVSDRQYRHGIGDDKITDDNILDTIEMAIEEITIALMQDEFDIYQNEDDYPTRGVKEGEPNRFVIKNKSNNLNLVCQLEAGDNEFTLTVITVMVKSDFRVYQGQYVVEV